MHRRYVLGLVFEETGQEVLVRRYPVGTEPHLGRLTGVWARVPDEIVVQRWIGERVLREEAGRLGLEELGDVQGMGSLVDGWVKGWEIRLLVIRGERYWLEQATGAELRPVQGLLLGRFGGIMPQLQYVLPMAQAVLRGEEINVDIRDRTI